MRFEYFVLEELEAGMVLSSSEVKSLRERKYFRRLGNMNIEEYKAANQNNSKPKKERKLLWHKSRLLG